MTENHQLAQQLALWGDQLRDISATGLRFSTSIYDRDNYRLIQDMAIALHALCSGELPEALEPLRGPLYSRPTPMAVGDAAVIDAQGRILLIRRADNHLWAMPGGMLAVGETPAEGVLREALEETGWRCAAVALMGVFDSRYCGTQSRNHLYHFQFLCRPVVQETDTPSYRHEVLDIAWFAEEALPADMDPGHVSRIQAAYEFWHGRSTTFFDIPSGSA